MERRSNAAGGSFGPSVEITGAQTLSEDARRNRVLRLELAGNSVPNSVILKQAAPLEDADEPRQRWDASRFASDWAGVQFLSDLGTDHAPRFYGGSLTKRFILLEDLGSEHLSLVEPLLQGGPDTATIALEQYAMRLGRMHADTFGRIEEYTEILNAIEPRLPPAWLHDFELEPRVIARARDLVAGLVEFEPASDSEIATVLEDLRSPDFLVYLRGDGCPDNVFATASGLRLIDFEFGHYGHALLDACYPRMTMPTCWCAGTLPSDTVANFERVYRRELARTCEAARDDGRFEKALVSACAFWLLTTLGWHLERVLEADLEEPWGLTTLRPRILSQLERFLELTGASVYLPKLTETFMRLADALARRWPGAQPAEAYPAFRKTL